MDKEEIIAKILANKWWPFDQVDPSILKEVERRMKKNERAQIEDALL